MHQWQLVVNILSKSRNSFGENENHLKYQLAVTILCFEYHFAEYRRQFKFVLYVLKRVAYYATKLSPIRKFLKFVKNRRNGGVEKK